MNGETADVLLQRASQLMQAGRLPEAIEAHERLLAAYPDLSSSWYNLGYLQRQAGQFEQALASYGQALERGIEQPEEVHLNRGVILADELGRADAALAELEAALKHNPGYVPALLNLGNLHEDLGRRDAAREAYERALAIDPANATALARLAGVTNVTSPFDPLIGRLRDAIAGAAPAGQAELGFALGQALDKAAAYDEAFVAYAAANTASRTSAGPGMPSYDPAQQERFIDQIIATFSRPATSAPAGPEEAPVFICGMFRSGSTLAEQILASHSRVSAGGELDLLPRLIQGELTPYPQAVAAAGPEKLAGLRKAYLERLRAIHPADRLVTDKRPDNFLHIGLIKTLFPEARIIHTVRNPLDNCLSVYFLHLDPSMAYALDLEHIGHWYRQYRRLMAHWKSLYPDIHDLDYDRLVADPRPEIERLLAFCGLPWEDSCLSFHEAETLVRTASVWQVREPLYRRSSGRWRHYERHLGPLRSALGDQL